MRTARLLGLVVVGLMLSSTLPLLAADSSPAPTTLSAPEVAATITLEELFGAPSAAENSPFLAASWSCPAYTQICSTSSQCDAYCGGAGWGACISFGGARRCCACNT